MLSVFYFQFGLPSVIQWSESMLVRNETSRRELVEKGLMVLEQDGNFGFNVCVC